MLPCRLMSLPSSVRRGMGPSGIFLLRGLIIIHYRAFLLALWRFLLHLHRTAQERHGFITHTHELPCILEGHAAVEQNLHDVDLTLDDGEPCIILLEDARHLCFNVRDIPPLHRGLERECPGLDAFIIYADFFCRER